MDTTVLDELPQLKINHALGSLPSRNKIIHAIKKMVIDKSPGQSGLSTNMIKSLPPQLLNLYVDFIQEFWNCENMDDTSWHTIVLNTLHKGKDNPQDPNNHQGITLKKTSAKTLSIVLADCLLKRLKQINTSQFGHIGCQEIPPHHQERLSPLPQHRLKSYAGFVDLVKAFDTVHHDLSYRILENMPYQLSSSRMSKNHTITAKSRFELEEASPNWTIPQLYNKVTTCLLSFSYSSCKLTYTLWLLLLFLHWWHLLHIHTKTRTLLIPNPTKQTLCSLWPHHLH